MVTSLVTVPDTAALEFIYNLGGAVCVNRLWMLDRQPPITTVQLQALAESAAGYWEANILPLLSSDIQLGLVRASSADLAVVVPSGFVFSGAFGGDTDRSYGASVAARVLFQWPIDVPLRAGSNFVPGIPDHVVTGNTMDSGFQSALLEAYNGIVDAAFHWGDTPAWRWVNVSLQDGNAPRSEGFTRRVIGCRMPSPYVNPQRRRLRTLVP